VLVGGNEGLVAELVLKVNSKRLDSVAHGVGGRYPWQVLEEVRDSAFVHWLLEVVIVV